MSINYYDISKFYNTLMQKTSMLYKYQFIIEIQKGIDNDLNPLNNPQNDPSAWIPFYCQSGKIPSFKINPAKISFYGTEFRTPTVRTFDHNWQCKILLTENMIVHQKIKYWMDTISNIKNNGGGLKIIPNINLKLNLLDPTHQVVDRTFYMVGVWPASMSDINLSYKQDDNTPLSVNVTFKYQYCYESDLRRSVSSGISVKIKIYKKS